LACRAQLAGQHGFFLSGQFHSRRRFPVME
jgi:hypothetical protein